MPTARRPAGAPDGAPRDASPLIAAPPRPGPLGVVTRPRPIFELAAAARTAALLERLGAAVAAYRGAHGAPPRDIEALDALREDERVDGWGDPLTLENTQGDTRIVSAGPDGRAGTGDDLVFEGGRVAGERPRLPLLRPRR